MTWNIRSKPMATDVMTPEEFRLKMIEASLIKSKYGNSIDKEVAHIAADNLMCELLEELGYVDGVKVFYDTNRWYA